jgi:hypothetical protein
MAPQVTVNYRENIYTSLTTPLVRGNTYSVSMYVSHTDNSQSSTNNLGLKFAMGPSFPINNIAHVYTSIVITDTMNWTLISGSFVADSAYNYIAVGNFFTDANTTTTVSCASCSFNQHGYYIDDISVVLTQQGEGIENHIEGAGKISVYPNPSSGSINVAYTSNIDELKVSDMLGQVVYEAKPKTTNTALTLTNAGVYFITLISGTEMSIKKVIISK